MASEEDIDSAYTTNETSSSNDSDDHVKVCVRIRPLLKDEVLKNNDMLAWTWEDNTVKHASTSNRIIDDSHFNSAYSFDYLFKPEHSNEYVFDSVVANIAEQAMCGFHGSVFAYGQSGSGKTFSMQGSHVQRGIIPQAIQYCFDSIQLYPDREFLFRVSYLEVYNEQIKDLLSTEPTQIKIQDGGLKVGVVISGVKEQVVLNPEQVIALMKAGEAQRHVGATGMNEKSSRAHTLFKLTIESSPKERTNGSTAFRVSTLSLVDLAGSENAKMTNSVGMRALEAKHINQSLLTLSTIIMKLSEEKPGTRKQHLPYRDSKLTRLMQASLSGNSNIVVLCTISPTVRCQDETNNTLKFAARAKKISTQAQVNETMDDKTLLKVYRQEIDQLRSKLQSLEMHSKFMSPSIYNSSSSSGGEGELFPEGGGMNGLNISDLDLEEDEGKSIMLNMIAEMERLILKADPTKPTTPMSKMRSIPKPTAATTTSPSSSATPAERNTPSPSSASTAAAVTPCPASPVPSTSASANKSSLRAPSTLRSSISKLPSRVKAAITSPTKSTPDAKSSTPNSFLSPRNDFQPIETAASSSSSSSSSSTAIAAGNTVKFAELEVSSSADVTADSAAAAASSKNGGGGQVLATVGQMLSMLKVHLTRTPTASTKSTARSKNYDAFTPVFTSTIEGNYSNGNSSKNSIDTIKQPDQPSIDRLTVDLQLKDADNRFLQEELEKKEKMLALLTQGLKEVEISQEEWLQANEALSQDLETALQENDELKAQIEKLNHLVEQKDLQLFELGFGNHSSNEGSVWKDSPTNSPRSWSPVQVPTIQSPSHAQSVTQPNFQFNAQPENGNQSSKNEGVTPVVVEY